MELTHQLAAPLKQLRLSGILDTLESRNQQAIKDKASHIDIFSPVTRRRGRASRPKAVGAAPAALHRQQHQDPGKLRFWL